MARAIELRNIVTSLGPAYIKLGQALSIRPDLLSPAAMVELQKLCDKVPSFDDKVAMAVVQQEFGKPWQEVGGRLLGAACYDMQADEIDFEAAAGYKLDQIVG